MPEYQLEIKQLVDYPRCRIYRQFIQSLISDRNIRTGGSSGLYYYTVLSSYANFRTSYRRLDGVSYTIYPGEWLCRVSELTEWFRVRFQHQAVSILKDLQDRHLITYNILGHGKLVKFKIKGWHKHNRVLDYNAPCQKDTGFFFLSIATASEIISYGRPSEMDILLDLWINTVYNDEQVQCSSSGPVVYMRNNTGNPLVSCSELAERWNISKATVSRYLNKFENLDYISLATFPGKHGTVICLQNYLSTMFQVSDVMLDKDEIAMELNITVNLDECVSDENSCVSKTNIETVVQKVAEILMAQGFPCFSCGKSKYKLLPLSEGCKSVILTNEHKGKSNAERFLLVISCGDMTETAKFELYIRPADKRRNCNE